MKQKAFAKINSKKKALHKQTVLDKAANNMKQASIIYNSNKIGRQS